jgi:hypothetical protein
MSSPIFYWHRSEDHAEGWYHSDETWSDWHGPFKTFRRAQWGLFHYCLWLNALDECGVPCAKKWWRVWRMPRSTWSSFKWVFNLEQPTVTASVGE